MCALVTGVQTCALPIFGTVELVEIARHALLDLGQAPLHLAPRDVPVSVIDRLELAAVDRHAGLAQQAEPAAELDHRTEERRVGKECVSTCSSRWSQYH